MEKMVIEGKLESLRKYLARLQDKCPSTVHELESSLDLQDILSVNLERAVQVSVDIAIHIISDSDEKAPSTMAESFVALEKLKIITPETSLRMQKAVGFRNIAVHEYDKLNWEIVFKVASIHIVDFKNFISELSTYYSL